MKQIVWQSAARAAALFVLFFGFTSAAGAFEVSPMRMEMSPSGSGASTVITVRNTLAEPLAIEVDAADRIVAEDGTQTFEPNEEDFLLFPPQAFIQPGASQAFRVQYIGDPNPAMTRSYVINVSQVPVKEFDGTGVRVVYRFGAAVYIHPKGAAPALSVEEVAAEDGKVRLKIRNGGNRLAHLTNDRVAITTPNATLSYEWDELRTQIGNPLLPPMSTRSFVFDAPGVTSGAQVSAAIYPKDD